MTPLFRKLTSRIYDDPSRIPFQVIEECQEVLDRETFVETIQSAQFQQIPPANALLNMLIVEPNHEAFFNLNSDQLLFLRQNLNKAFPEFRYADICMMWQAYSADSIDELLEAILFFNETETGLFDDDPVMQNQIHVAFYEAGLRVISKE